MKTEVYKVLYHEDVDTAARRGQEALRAGGLVAFPTETVYGLAVNAADGQAFARLRELKDRPDRPFSVHIGRAEQALLFVPDPPERARRVMAKAWPGPITLVLAVPDRPDWPHWPKATADRLYYNGSIALRCPLHPVAQKLLAAEDMPIVAPSANYAGKAPPGDAQAVLAQLEGQVDLVIDAGPTRWRKASTIVAFDAAGGYQILREGVYDRRIVESFMQRRVLFVCTGNTCRSAMAEGLAKAALADRLGCEVGELADRGWQVTSAGTMNLGGSPSPPEALQAAGELGADISAHRSRFLTPELINSSDLIFCMTDSHRAEVLYQAPSAAERTFLLDPAGDVDDPIGQGIEVYQQVARRIAEAIQHRLSEMLR